MPLMSFDTSELPRPEGDEGDGVCSKCPPSIIPILVGTSTIVSEFEDMFSIKSTGTTYEEFWNEIA